MCETIVSIVGTAVLTTLLEFIVSCIKNKSNEKKKKYNVYREFYILWDSIMRGRAFDFTDLTNKDQNKILNFLISKETYFDSKINDLIYRLKTNYLDNYENNTKINKDECNKCYRELTDILVDKENKYRKKYNKLEF